MALVSPVSIRNRIRVVLLRSGPFVPMGTIEKLVQPKERGDKKKLKNLAVQVGQVRRTIFEERGIEMRNGVGRMQPAEVARLQEAWDKSEAKLVKSAARKAA